MKDYSRDKGFIRRFRDGALEIARRKMREVEEGRARTPTIIPLGPRLGTGGGFGGFFLWDTVFGAIWARHAGKGEFPILSSLDNLYMLAQPDGFIVREYDPRGRCAWSPDHPVSFAAPVLSWAEVMLFEDGVTGVERLRKVFPALVRHHESCRRFMRPDGLAYGDMFGCGMDDIERWPYDASDEAIREGGIKASPGMVNPELKEWLWDNFISRPPLQRNCSWNKQAGWIDMTCEMAFDALNIAKIARVLGDAGTEARMNSEHAAFYDAVNEKCWNEKAGFYCDYADPRPGIRGGVMDRKCAAGFWALLSRMATPERGARVIETLKDPAVFNRPIPFPSLSADDPKYAPETAYWCGPVWPPTMYVALRGLMEWGEKDFADDAARRYYNANAALWEKTGTLWENISSEQCDREKVMSGPDFCGWSALAPVALPEEFGWV